MLTIICHHLSLTLTLITGEIHWTGISLDVELNCINSLFFPSTTVLWNALPDTCKSIDSIACFKRYLKSNDSVVPLYFYTNNRVAEVIHRKLRLEISDLNGDLSIRHLTNNASCRCGFSLENAHHFFFDCPLYSQVRDSTIFSLDEPDSLTLHCLLYGNSDKSLSVNKHIFERVHEFICLSKRFS